MKIGLSKSDITPPVGCELAGFGHYLGRQSNAVFDPLYASALAVEDNGSAALLISCNLLLVTAAQTAQIRAFITEAAGMEPDKSLVQKPGWAASLKGPVDHTAHVVKFVAGCLMVDEGGGGRSTDFSGKVWDLESPSIVGTNGRIHSALLELLRE